MSELDRCTLTATIKRCLSLDPSRGATSSPSHSTDGRYDLTTAPTLALNPKPDLYPNARSCAQIYTHAGPVLIAVNPFKGVPTLYTDAVLRHYKARRSGEHQEGFEPHIFLTADKVRFPSLPSRRALFTRPSARFNYTVLHACNVSTPSAGCAELGHLVMDILHAVRRLWNQPMRAVMQQHCVPSRRTRTCVATGGARA